MIKEINKENLKKFSICEIDSPFRHYFCYEKDGICLGYVSIDIIYDKIEIINIYVKEEYRNRKIGTDMLKYIIKFARNNKIINITLEVRENNYYAIKLYESNGFKKIAKRENYYNLTDGILMELIL